MNERNELDRYLEVRRLDRQLNAKLIAKLPKKALEECAKDLGYWFEGALKLSGENDLSILFDYTLHNYQKNGRNVIEYYQALNPDGLTEDERLILAAKAQSRHTLIQVNNVVPNLGVNVLDLLYHDSFFLTDQGMGDSGYPGLIIATRIQSLPGLVITSGAPLPLFGPALQGVLAYLSQKVYPRPVAQFSREEKIRLEAIIILIARARGTMG